MRRHQHTGFRHPAAASRQCPRHGALTVEFALVVPLLFLLFLGGLELTTMNMIRHSAGNAAYEAARRAALPGGTKKAAKEEALATLEALGAANNTKVDVEITANYAEVTIAVPVAKNSWGLGRFSGNLTIRKTCKLTREQSR
ncbi:MAG: TadE/TadG family type IV pilus assembly protein [Fuerstiella sp.]